VRGCAHLPFVRETPATYLLLACALAIPCCAQTIQPALIQPQDRIVSAVNTGARVAIPNSVHPAIAGAQSSQPVDPAFALDHIILNLEASAAQQAALTTLLMQQQDPDSPNLPPLALPATT
jgi:hypothetical protein